MDRRIFRLWRIRGRRRRRVGGGLEDFSGVVARGCHAYRGAGARGRRFQTGLTAADTGAASRNLNEGSRTRSARALRLTSIAIIATLPTKPLYIRSKT